MSKVNFPTSLLAATALAVTFGTGGFAASLDGFTIQASAAYPNIPGSTTAGPISAVIGAGIEFADGQFTPFFGPSFDFSGDTLTITHDQTGHASGTFNGYIFNDILAAIGDFSGFSILSDTFGFFSGDPSRVSFDAENLYVNFESLSFVGFSSDAQLVLKIETAGMPDVPLPAALPLMLAGLGGLAAVRRRKS
jgi:hypothetical protein